MRRLIAACLVFAAGMAVSSLSFFAGRELDANELVLSNLLSRSENPRGYEAAALATLLCAVLLWKLVSGWVSRAGLSAAAAVGVLAPFEEMYGQPHILLAFAAFILLTGGLAWNVSDLARSSRKPTWIAAAVTGWMVLAFLIYLLFTPDYFHTRRGWQGLAACEWALCGWIALQIAVLKRNRHVTIVSS